MQEHVWVVQEFVDDEWFLVAAYYSRNTARRRAQCLPNKTRVRKFIAA